MCDWCVTGVCDWCVAGSDWCVTGSDCCVTGSDKLQFYSRMIVGAMQQCSVNPM